MDVAAWILGVIALLGILGCVGLLLATHVEQHRRLRAAVSARIGSHGVWVGAFLVAIPGEEAGRVRSEAEQCSAEAEPTGILDIWANAGGRLIGHVRGPEVITEAEACGWLEHASNDLTRAWLPPPPGRGKQVFALVYAGTSPPPIDASHAGDLLAFLSGAGLLGAAFVACPSVAGDATASRRQVAILGLGAAVVMAIAAVVSGVVSSFSTTPEGERSPQRATPASPAQPPPAPPRKKGG